MYRAPAGHMCRPPSPYRARSTHQPLSIRTTTHPAPTTTQQGPSLSPPSPPQPPHPPYPTYPLPISPEKFSKALKLYNRYRLEEGLAQRVQEPQSATDGSHLNIRSHARAHSLTSGASSIAYAPSVSTSAYEGITDLSSLVSFTDNESPTSATANASTELTSFNGKKVKQRLRRPLSARAKAKAALIRHLESCWVCRSRRVPCPLEHHDIKSLEKAREAKAHRQHPQSQHQASSSISGSSNWISGTTHTAQLASGGSRGQAHTLLGLGQNEELLQTFSTEGTNMDPQSPAYADPLAEIQAPAPSNQDIPGPIDLLALDLDTDPYSTYQDGQMIALGIYRGYFFCQHLDGLCERYFADEEALQVHFETSHFAFTRISPAHRYICYVCHGVNNFPVGSCYCCGAEGSIQMWIYGNFIRIPTYQRYAPDGQDLIRHGSSSMPFFASSYALPNMDNQQGGGAENSGNFDTDTNRQGYYVPNNNTYQDPGSQGGGSNAYDTPQSGGYAFQGTYFSGFQHRAKMNPFLVRYGYAESLPKYGSYKLILLIVALVAAITVIFKAHEWIFTKERLFKLHSHPNLPVIGFVGALASFAICYTYWSVKKFGIDRVRLAQCRPPRCPLHDLPIISFKCKQTAPDPFVRGGIFS